MRTQLEQQYEANGSTSGGPRVPVPVHPLIQSAYASVLPQDQFINNWETSSKLTISGMTRSSDGSDDHVISYKSSICAFTASVTGSLSSNFIVIGTLLNQRNYMSSLTSTSTASLSSFRAKVTVFVASENHPSPPIPLESPPAVSIKLSLASPF